MDRSDGHDAAQLAAEVLHELRQPLLGIKGYFQLMAEGAEPPPVSLLLAQVERMEQIIADYTRWVSDKPLPKERLELGNAVKNALGLFRHNPDSARCHVDLDLQPGVELNGASRLLEQLTLNLLNNARDAMGGRGRIKVTVTREGDRPALYVADWGPGISPELRAKLFEPYATTKPKGSGLGLSVCRRIAEEHGGEVGLADPKLAGEPTPPATLFRVTFPPLHAAAKARPRVLVVDDEEIIRRIFVDLLGKECEVVEAQTAEGALAELERSHRFELIVTDKNLPGLSGLELAQKARALDPRSRVMIMTGYPSLVTAQQAVELGVIDYLIKPFDDIRQVRDQIRLVLSQTSAEPNTAKGRCVRVLEDNPHSARAIVEAVSQLGLEPLVVSDPKGAQASAPQACAGVVVSWGFGGLPGKDAVAQARAQSGGAPVVVLVDHLTLETTLEALRAGCSACLPKLLSDPRALSRELQRALRLSGG